MSADKTNKKRKTDNVAEEAPDVNTFSSSLAALKATGPTLYPSLSDYLEGTVSDSGDVSKILASTYIRSAAMENRFLVPPQFSSFTIERNKVGEVVSIKDQNTKKQLSGHRLEKIMAYYMYSLRDIETVILQRSEKDGRVEALTVPKGIQFETVQKSGGEKEWYGELRTLYLPKQRITVYVSAKSFEKVVALDYMTISDVREVCCALNTLQGKEDSSDIDPEKLTTFEEIETAIRAYSTRKAKQTFLESMLACKMRAAPIEETVQHFALFPTYYLSQRCAFRLPHNGVLFTKMENKRSTAVPLGTLQDTDEVLLRSNVVSQSEFLGVRGDIAGFHVHKDSSELGMRKNGKWKELTGKKRMSVALVKQMLAAMVRANEATARVVAPVPFTEDDDVSVSTFEEDDLSV